MDLILKSNCKFHFIFFVQIQLLESLLESWSEYENNVQCLKSWFETQEKRLKQHQIGDQASVQNALKDCQVSCPGS